MAFWINPSGERLNCFGTSFPKSSKVTTWRSTSSTRLGKNQTHARVKALILFIVQKQHNYTYQKPHPWHPSVLGSKECLGGGGGLEMMLSIIPIKVLLSNLNVLSWLRWELPVYFLCWMQYRVWHRRWLTENVIAKCSESIAYCCTFLLICSTPSIKVHTCRTDTIIFSPADQIGLMFSR